MVLHIQVKSVEQQVVLKRVKRDYHPPTDAKWAQQWYLVRVATKHCHEQLHVLHCLCVYTIFSSGFFSIEKTGIT